jgi:hypothetical protein
LTGNTAGNPNQPATHRSRFVHAIRPARKDDKHGLESILDQVGANEPGTDAMHERAVPSNEIGEGVFVARLDEPAEQFRIAWVCGDRSSGEELQDGNLHRTSCRLSSGTTVPKNRRFWVILVPVPARSGTPVPGWFPGNLSTKPAGSATNRRILFLV